MWKTKHIALAATLVFGGAGIAAAAPEAPLTPPASNIADAGVESRTLEHAGRARSYLLVRPAGAARAPRALVLVLHGGGGNAENALRMTGFADLARAEGFVAAFPEGSARFGRLRTWNAGHCCGFARQQQVDDVGFLGALIDALVREGIADPRRVYITGMSNGAMMAHRAGIGLAGRVAAIAPVVGGVFGDEPSPRAPVSVLTINGALDRSIPLDGGPTGGRFASAWDGTPLLPARAQAAFWARADGCTAQPDAAQPHTELAGALETVSFTCPRGIAVRGIVVRDGGHAWPGGQRGSRLGDAPSMALNATRTIWAFFRDHPQAE